jgi:hypothetical protein
VFLLDSLLVGGLKFVLDKIATAADTELNDDTALREQLLNAQMQVELGEMSEEAFAALEADILQRLRDIRERREGGPRAPGEGMRVTGVEATFGGDETDR